MLPLSQNLSMRVSFSNVFCHRHFVLFFISHHSFFFLYVGSVLFLICFFFHFMFSLDFFTFFESETGSNSSNGNIFASSLPWPRNKKIVGNRTRVGWKHGVNVLGNEKRLNVIIPHRHPMEEFLNSSIILLVLDMILNLLPQCQKKLKL